PFQYGRTGPMGHSPDYCWQRRRRQPRWLNLQSSRLRSDWESALDALALPLFDVAEQPVPRTCWASELHRAWKSVVTHVAPDPHVGHAEALAYLPYGQVASVVRDTDAMFESRDSTHVRGSFPRSRIRPTTVCYQPAYQ